MRSSVPLFLLSLLVSPLASPVFGLQNAQPQPLGVTADSSDHVRIVPHQASAETLERYDTFLRRHWLLFHMATSQPLGPGYSLSLAFFESADGVGSWGLLISYETMKEEMKYSMRRFFQTQHLQPLDPTTDRFIYAITPRLRFARFLSNRGNVSVFKPLVTDKNKPSTVVGALYTSGDPRHSDAMATIGGVVLAVNEREERAYYGITLATVWNGEPEEELAASPFPDNDMQRPFYSPPIDRGESEVVVEVLDDTTSAIISDDAEPAPTDGYRVAASIQDYQLASDKPIDLNLRFGIWAGNWALVTLDDQDYPHTNRLRSGEAIGLGEEEPAAGSTLFVATANDFASLPRCTLLDSGVDVITPYTAGSRRASRFQLQPGSKLHTRDIGAWILEETSKGLKACYQIVALEAPDMIYAIPMIKILGEASRSRHTLTLPVSSWELLPMASL